MTSFAALKARHLKNPEVLTVYEALAEEFSFADRLIRARTKANLTQAQVAARMKTSQSYIAKLEGGQVSPSIKALQRYAAAIGARMTIDFEPLAPTAGE